MYENNDFYNFGSKCFLKSPHSTEHWFDSILSKKKKKKKGSIEMVT